jgi:hypothetical protein
MFKPDPRVFHSRGRAANRLPAAAAVLALLLSAACGGPEGTPEAQIRELVDRAEQGAENHEISVFRASLADDYRDNHGYDRRTVLRLIQGILLRNQQIHLFSVVRDIRVQADTAEARVLVAMAGRPIESADALLNVRADLVRFDVQFVREGNDWLVRAADWQRAELDDFL